MRDEEACCRQRKMEGVRTGPPNAVRHHGKEKEEVALNIYIHFEGEGS
jgi:hypothetical protein